MTDSGLSTATTMQANEFADLERTLKHNGIGHSVCVVDMTALRHNIRTIKALLPKRAPGKAPFVLRLTDKSIPCLPLLAQCETWLGTSRHMIFHLPFLNASLQALPNGEFLFGKPVPGFAIAHWLQNAGDSQTRKHADLARVQWLVDSRERLLELAAIAHEYAVKLRVSLEIDIGLHRGGIPLEQFAEVVRTFSRESFVQFAGLMGYDAHVGKVPWKSRSSAHRDVAHSYQAFVDLAGRVRAESVTNLCLNGSGSLTIGHLVGDEAWFDLSVGSALLKPTDFDIPALQALLPALYIATPVLKAQAGISLPGLTFRAPLRDTVFVAGGNFDGTPVFPEGLGKSPIYGDSFNQMGIHCLQDAGIKREQFVFFRPRQSESIMLRHGSIVAYERGQTGTFARMPVLAE
jgi:D-serine deaminase-like pyridoxal phosphate-dependent protein